jgi:lycopene beta-cyclase
MTYLGFLSLFLVLPILILGGLLLRDQRLGRKLPAALQGWSAPLVLALLIAIAVVYTTPWDNHLVATSVWWYNPQLVTGITFGWVPLEEYLFFALEPVAVGLWMLLLARHLPAPAETTRPAVKARVIPVIVVGLWIVGVGLLLSRWRPGTYLGLELVWGLPPILLQLFFGLETLVQHRRLVLITILSSTLYFSLADTLAIHSGIWTIDPQQSLGIMIGQGLPLEEVVFFLLTTTLVTVGLVLGIARASRSRIRTLTATGDSLSRRIQDR